jgi:hypothetical protein
MSLLVNLSEKGYHSLKKDKKNLEKRIDSLKKELDILNGMMKEFNQAIDLLKYLYEPSNVRISYHTRNPKLIVGQIYIKHPVRVSIGFRIGEAKEFKGLDDPALIDLALQKAKEKLKEKFPIYFE